jgi:hypothetical protein
MQSTFEQFPIRMVLLANAVSLAIYASGAYVFAQWSPVAAVLYVAYCAWVESGVLRRSCAHCYYYGKRCAFGKGKLCALLLPKGESRKFVERKVTWRDLVPDILVMLLPLLAGIALLVRHYSWAVLGALAVLLALSFAGNAFVRGSFACKYCKQKEFGCPASELFGKANRKASAAR